MSKSRRKVMKNKADMDNDKNVLKDITSAKNNKGKEVKQTQR